MTPLVGRVRPAGERDLDRLAELFTLGLEHHAGAGPRFALASGAAGRARALLAAWLRDGSRRVLVFESGADLPGLCVAAVARRPPLFAETECGCVEHLVVREAARRRGVGRALAREALDWLRARGVGRVEISVARGNAGGRAFWDALGFAPAMDVLERPL